MPHRSENATAAMFNEADQTGQPLADLSKRDPIRVLHVEDDPVCREVIADELSDHGFVVRSFADAISLADGLAVSSEADIILLDWDLPDVSGIELLVELRQCGVNLPVVFLTGYGFTAQENLAFETGAVDFIDKARGVEILARRLRRLLKAPKPAAVPSAGIVCGKLLLNPKVGRAYWNDRDVGLTPGRVQHRPPLGVEGRSLGDLSNGLRPRTLRGLHRRERRRRLSDQRSSNYQAHT
jgi:CheY-like chemotaxis protein